VPRAGPLRYWSLTLIGVAVVLASLAVEAWGFYNLFGTESCGTRTTADCSSETALHIVAVSVGPFVGIGGMILLAFRGGGTRGWLSRFRPRSRRLADRIARGETHMPTVVRPGVLPEPIPPLIPVPKPVAATTGRNPIERLQDLDELKAKSLISAAEYEAQKKRILGGV
jgi:hypothetical protein